jgi:hypothetical protein
MRKNPREAPANRLVGWLSLVVPVALAAATVVGCSSSTGSTPVRAASAPAPVAQPVASRPFRSPSGNISCTLSTPGGYNEARCEVTDHAWAATEPPDCHMNWGDRLYVTQNGDAGFGCYHQEFPAGEQTLEYGQTLSLGAIRCESEPTTMTCTDSSTGHYFRVSRETYEFG